jgi:tRNA(fMet)-specific endonuclease VapC
MDSAHRKYLLDTNAVSHLLTGRPAAVRKRVVQVAFEATCISTVTEAELRYGLAKKPGAIKERIAVEAYLANAAILAWDSAAAQAYALLRAEQEGKGRPLSAEDLMIAAHALSLGLVLVTSDRAFSSVDGLRTEDWTIG